MILKLQSFSCCPKISKWKEYKTDKQTEIRNFVDVILYIVFQFVYMIVIFFKCSILLVIHFV